MAPLFAFFPVCVTFLALGVLGVVMYLAGAGTGPGDGPADGPPPKPNLPNWWVMAAILGAVAAVLGVLAWYTSDY